MKRILLAAMASIALLISSCGKSDDSSGDITGIWQLESETVNGQSQTINECGKTTVIFNQNQATTHSFSKNTGVCKYHKNIDTYQIIGNTIKGLGGEDESFTFSLSGNTLTFEIIRNGEKGIHKFKKITQAELDAFLATVNNNNGGGNKNAQNLEGIWQKESETVDGQSQTIDDCEKKSAVVFTQNQITTHAFIENAGACRYTKQLHTYKIEGNAIKSNEDPSISFPFSVSGNTLTIESVNNGKKTIIKYKKITQTELDAILATVNNNNGGGNKNAQNLEGIWQIESETVNGQSQRINDCEKKTVAVFTQNQITTHDFIENAGVCRYSKSTKSYRIEGNVIKSDTDPDESLSFSVSGNTFTIEFVENAKIFVFKYRKITQAQLDAILATVNNGGN